MMEHISEVGTMLTENKRGMFFVGALKCLQASHEQTEQTGFVSLDGVTNVQNNDEDDAHLRGRSHDDGE